MKTQRWEITIKCKLKYIVIANTLKKAKTKIKNIELPKEYVEDSFLICNTKLINRINKGLVYN